MVVQVAKHNSRDSLWIIVDDMVYDATRHVGRLPSGNDEQFANLNMAHRRFVDLPSYKMVMSYLVGGLDMFGTSFIFPCWKFHHPN